MASPIFGLEWFQLFVATLLLVILFLEVWDRADGFVNFSDPNNIRSHQLVNGMSTGDRQAEAIARMPKGAGVSSMTGSREAPVFWQDYDYDMISSKTGLKNSREGMEDKKNFTIG